ncbi:MAG: substrate-binding domain-containing protein [Lachnospiraceae bacterium]|nr:substrate-binding domain-containing protein [Lachnospiraceae bacterium]
MKHDRIYKWAGAVFLILMVILSLLFGLYLSRGGSAANQSISSMTRVSVILPHENDGYWELIRDGIKEAEEELGEENGIDISILIPQLNYNVAQMIDLLKQQIAARVDIIVVQGNGDEEFNSTLEKAYSQGIKIICVDTDSAEAPRDLYIGTDNAAAGEMLGEHLAELAGGRAKTAVISGELGYPNLEQRLQAVEEVLKEYPEMEISSVSYDAYDGLTAMRLFHQKSEGADALLFLEGTGGTSLEKIYQEHSQEYEYILGFDAYEGVRKGVLDGIVKQDTHQMGRRVVEEIARYIQEGSFSSERIYTDIYWMTSDNYEEIMMITDPGKLTETLENEDTA